MPKVITKQKQKKAAAKPKAVKQVRFRDKPVQAWFTDAERERVRAAGKVAIPGGMKAATFLRWAALHAAKQLLARAKKTKTKA